MASPGWGPGWPRGATGTVVTVRCGALGLRLPVRQEIAPLVAGLVTELERVRLRPFTPEWSWGYANRPIANTLTPSNHSRATAIDLDAPENPYTTNPAAKHTMPLSAGVIASRWGFRWGGLWRPKRDYMHYELAVTPLGAAALIADLRALDGRPVPIHPWPWEADVYPPSTVIARIVLPVELGFGLDADAYLNLCADGTIQRFGATPAVVAAGSYPQLKPEFRLGGPRYFTDGWLGDSQKRVLPGGPYFTCLAHDGNPYQFGPDTVGMLQR
jgi:hypothetical protein